MRPATEHSSKWSNKPSLVPCATGLSACAAPAFGAAQALEPDWLAIFAGPVPLVEMANPRARPGAGTRCSQGSLLPRPRRGHAGTQFFKRIPHDATGGDWSSSPAWIALAQVRDVYSHIRLPDDSMYAVNADAPQHPASRALLDAARDPSTTLYVTSQILCEFYSVITNPRRVATASSAEKAVRILAAIRALPGVSVLPTPARAVAGWMRLSRRCVGALWDPLSPECS